MSEGPIILHNQTEGELRIDKFLAENLDNYSRSFIQKLISEGGVNVDGFPINKKSELILVRIFPSISCLKIMT